MDPMVIKYLLLTVVAYGLHTFLAFTQIILALFLICSAVINLRNKSRISKWPSRLGLVINEQLAEKPLHSWLMVLTGIFLFLPLLKLSYWFAVIGCIASVYWILSLSNAPRIAEHKAPGGLIRKGLLISAVLLLGFTVWEGRDLVRAGWDVNSKAIYWRNLEVAGWQKENNPNAPKIGETAPDFMLTDVHGKETVRLSDFRGKRPVVLLFGSFT